MIRTWSPLVLLSLVFAPQILEASEVGSALHRARVQIRPKIVSPTPKENVKGSFTSKVQVEIDAAADQWLRGISCVGQLYLKDKPALPCKGVVEKSGAHDLACECAEAGKYTLVLLCKVQHYKGYELVLPASHAVQCVP